MRGLLSHLAVACLCVYLPGTLAPSRATRDQGVSEVTLDLQVVVTDPSNGGKRYVCALPREEGLRVEMRNLRDEERVIRQVMFRRASGFTLDGFSASLLIFTPRSDDEQGRLVWGMHLETDRIGSLMQIVGPISEPNSVKNAYASISAARKP